MKASIPMMKTKVFVIADGGTGMAGLNARSCGPNGHF